MRTNVDIDEVLIEDCVKLTGLRTKKEIINLALKELVASRKRRKILDYAGKLHWVGDLKEMRRNRI